MGGELNLPAFSSKENSSLMVSCLNGGLTVNQALAQLCLQLLTNNERA